MKILTAGGLLKFVNEPLKLTCLMRINLKHETLVMFHIDIILDVFIQECSLHIHLLNLIF